MKRIQILIATIFFKSILIGQIPPGEAWYQFCNNGNDMSGKGKTATVTACFSTINRFGQVNNGYEFIGTSYVDIPNSTIMGFSSYCYSMWIFISSNPINTECIFSGGGNDIYDQNLLIMPSGYLMAVSHNSGGSPSASSVSSQTLTLNQWHHVVVLRNSTLMQMYVDNVLKTGTYHNGTSARWGSTSPYNIFLGVRSNGLDYFNGRIDDVRLYTGNLNASQVNDLYQEAVFPNVTASGDTICKGESGQIIASGATTYTLPGGPSGVVKPLNTTTYNVTGNSLGCVTTITTQVLVDLCTILKDDSYENEIKVHPNPGNGTFVFTSNLPDNTRIYYTLEDLSGRMIKSGETSVKETIETGASPGTYILRLYLKEKHLANKIMIVAP